MPICAIYARVSTEQQSESVENQVTFLTEFAKRKGNDWCIKNEYIYRDNGISGTSIVKRPAVQQLVHDGELKLFDIVLFKGISRFARDTVDAINMLRVLRSSGVRVISFEENFDSDSSPDELIFQIHASVAQYESIKIGIRTKIGHYEMAKRGRWSHGSSPYGYTIDGDTKKLIIVEEESKIVRMIFNMYLKGKGMWSIAKYLNEHGIYTRNGSRWGQFAIRYILKNQVYIGTVIFGVTKTKRQYKINDPTVPIKVKFKTDDDVVIVKNAHPPIIEEEIFKMVQEILVLKSSRSDKSTNYLLSSMIVCPQCNKKMVATRWSYRDVHGNQSKKYSYRCRTRSNYGATFCSQPAINGPKFEKKVVEGLLLKLKALDYEAIKKYSENNVAQSLGSTIEDIDKYLNNIQSQLINANQKNMNGVLDDDSFATIVKELQGKKKNLIKEKNNLAKRIADKSTDKAKVDLFMRSVTEFLKMDVYNTDPEYRQNLRVLLRRIINKIEIGENNDAIITINFTV